MSLFATVKDAVVGQAMRLVGDPRVSKLMGDPRVVNAAMKAMSVGGAIKTELDKAGRFAAGMLGLATQEEISKLRSTIQGLEDTVASLEASHSTSGGTPPATNG